jgi:hypothetical protein
MKNFKILFIIVLSLIYQKGFSQFFLQDKVCFYMMNTEIRATVEEDPRQYDMRNGAVQNFGLEEVNKGEFKKMDETTQKIRSRLSSVSLLIQGVPFAWNITKYTQGTYEYQSKIFQELQDAPAFIIVALPDQISFAQQLQQNTLFLYGIIASYGVINQMESKERRILLKFAEEEFQTLFYQAIGIYSKIRTAKATFAWKKAMFFAGIEEDKKMFKEIIQNL